MESATGVEASVAVAAAGEAAAKTAEAIAAAENVATAVVENAVARVAAAEQTAQQIADAALATALGNRVNTIDERISKWEGEGRAELSSVKAEIAEMRSQLTGFQTSMTELLSTAQLTRPTLPDSTTETSPATETIMPAETVENAEQTLEESAAPAKRTIRRVWA